MDNNYSQQLKNTEQAIVPPNERLVIDTIATEYELNDEERRLLFAIRKVENGGPGKEFGVLNSEAMRFKNDPARSLIIQAKWAAGTIKKRYKGDLDTFSKRYAPVGASNDPNNLNKNWKTNISYYMDILNQNEVRPL